MYLVVSNSFLKIFEKWKQSYREILNALVELHYELTLECFQEQLMVCTKLVKLGLFLDCYGLLRFFCIGITNTHILRSSLTSRKSGFECFVSTFLPRHSQSFHCKRGNDKARIALWVIMCGTARWLGGVGPSAL